MKGIALFAGTILVLAAGVRTENKQAKSDDRVIVRVNDEVITLSDFNLQMGGVREQLARQYTGDQLAQQVKQAENEALENLVREKLCLQKAKELGIGKDVESQVAAEIDQILKENRLKDVNELESALRQQGQTLAVYREFLRKQLVINALITEFVDSRIEPSSAEVQEYYKSHAKEYSIPPMVTLSEIFFPAEPADTQAASRMSELRSRLLQGEPFAKLAAQYSKGPTAGGGGGIGDFEMEKLPSRVSAAIASLKVGGVSEVVKSDDGYALYRLDARKPASTRPLDTVSDEIKQLLYSRKRPAALESYFDQLKKDAHIQYLDEFKKD